MSEQNKKHRWWIPLAVGLIAFVGSALGAALPVYHSRVKRGRYPLERL